ncbi:MAG: DoxX family protein [Burkholderiales bacterium]
MNAFLAKASPVLLSVLRIVTGFLFIQHGTQKWLLFPSGTTRASVETLSGVAGLMELAGGALIIAGLFTRPVAFLLSGLMAFAYFIAHAPQGFWPIQNRGELAALYCFVFLYLAVAGGGPLSLDRLVRRG